VVTAISYAVGGVIVAFGGLLLLGLLFGGSIESDPEEDKQVQVEEAASQARAEHLAREREAWTAVGIICADGWNTPSRGSGMCSYHGGASWVLWVRSTGEERRCPLSTFSRPLRPDTKLCPYDW
jgi:hypothetical protein